MWIHLEVARCIEVWAQPTDKGFHGIVGAHCYQHRLPKDARSSESSGFRALRVIQYAWALRFGIQVSWFDVRV